MSFPITKDRQDAIIRIMSNFLESGVIKSNQKDMDKALLALSNTNDKELKDILYKSSFVRECSYALDNFRNKN